MASSDTWEYFHEKRIEHDKGSLKGRAQKFSNALDVYRQRRAQSQTSKNALSGSKKLGANECTSESALTGSEKRTFQKKSLENRIIEPKKQKSDISGIQNPPPLSKKRRIEARLGDGNFESKKVRTHVGATKATKHPKKTIAKNDTTLSTVSTSDSPSIPFSPPIVEKIINKTTNFAASTRKLKETGQNFPARQSPSSTVKSSQPTPVSIFGDNDDEGDDDIDLFSEPRFNPKLRKNVATGEQNGLQDT